jgi:hypothetical protein
MSAPAHDPIEQTPQPMQPGDPDDRNALETGFDWILLAVRALTVVPVLVLLLSALGAFAYGTALFIHSADDVISHPFPVRHNVGLFLIEVDLFLIGATLMITAIGFFELFLSPGAVGPATTAGLACRAGPPGPQDPHHLDARPCRCGRLRRHSRELRRRAGHSVLRWGDRARYRVADRVPAIRLEHESRTVRLRCPLRARMLTLDAW